MKRPSFQFYPGDWQANSRLRRCTHEEKGVWIDVLCLLHDQDEYGIARWPLKEIAQAIGTSVAKLKALVTKGVLKGADVGHQCEAFIFTPTGSGRKKKDPVVLIEAQDGPLWYSSRMVEDEYKRIIRGEYGEAPKAAPDHAPKPPIGDAPKDAPDHAPSRAGASSSSPPSVNSEPNGSDGGAVKSPAEMNKTELWVAGKSLLETAGLPKAQCGSFVGKLVKDYGDSIVVEAVRAAVIAQPADPIEYLKATCLHSVGQRTSGGRTPAPENFADRDYGQGGKL